MKFSHLAKLVCAAVLVAALAVLVNRVKALEAKVSLLETTIFFILQDRAKGNFLPDGEDIIYDKI